MAVLQMCVDVGQQVRAQNSQPACDCPIVNLVANLDSNSTEDICINRFDKDGFAPNQALRVACEARPLRLRERHSRSNEYSLFAALGFQFASIAVTNRRENIEPMLVVEHEQQVEHRRAEARREQLSQ